MVNDYLSNTNFFHDVHPTSASFSYAHSTDSTDSLESTRTRRGLGLLAPVASILRGSASLLHAYRDGLSEEQRTLHRKTEEKKQVLHIRLKNATCMGDYKAAATQLDAICDNHVWKSDKKSDDYDYELIQAKLRDLDDARISCDVSRMLYLVRTALSRDLGNMGNVRLYKHSYVGTKDLIERYIDSTLETIRALVKMPEESLPRHMETKDVLEQVLYARQAFGRSALLLSGGATFGMNHIGVLKALFEARLLPRIISGASAGSIVCSVLCTRTDEEIPEMLARFPYGDLAVFEEDGKGDGILGHVERFLTQGAWIDIKHLSRVMQEMLGDMTFQESYNRTRRILNICVSSASIYELPRLLNYITSPNIMIWSAVAASCSVPLLFSAAPLLVKNPITGQHEEWNPSPQKWVDGSVDNDLPMVKLAEMFNVNHFLVSQVNPHVVPFLEKDEALITASAQASSSTVASGADWAYKLTTLAKGEAIHRLHVMSDMGIFPNMVTKLRSVLSQKYSGDITILPEINYKDFPRMLKNPTSDFMLDACLRGERATWPKLSRIRNHCAVELELDAAVQSLRARVVFSPSQVDLRRMSAVGAADSTGFGRRTRRVSGSNVQPLSTLAKNGDGTDEDDAETGYFGYGSGSRPPIRSHSSYWSARDKQYLPPLSRSMYSQVSTSSSVPIQAEAASPAQNRLGNSNPITPTRKPPQRLAPPSHLDIPTFSPGHLLSETETDLTPSIGNTFGSDADVDSHTDDSSPEHSGFDPDTQWGLNSMASMNSTASHRKKVHPEIYQANPASIFTTSQPATPGTGLYAASLALNATTPPSFLFPSPSSENLGMRTPLGTRTPGSRTPTRMPGSRTPVGPLMSPELAMTRGRDRSSYSGRTDKDESVGKSERLENSGMASSPERLYKRLFHGDGGGDDRGK